MNKRIAHLFAAIALIGASAGALAQESHPLSREEVRAETLRARAAGELDLNETNTPFIPPAPPSTVTRQEIRAEAVRARAAGELDYNDTNYPLAAHEAPSAVTRAAVRAEAVRARAAGELDWTEANYPLAVSGLLHR